MTAIEWRDELTETLAGTDWVLHWSGVSPEYPVCLADVRHRTTNESKQIELSRDVFRTRERRQAEARRQLLQSETKLQTLTVHCFHVFTSYTWSL